MEKRPFQLKIGDVEKDGAVLLKKKKVGSKWRLTWQHRSIAGLTESRRFSFLYQPNEYFTIRPSTGKNPVKRKRKKVSSSLKKATSTLRRSITIRKGSKTLEILPQARGMVKATVKVGAKTIQAVFSSIEEALKWGMEKIGIKSNPEQVKVIRAIRNPAKFYDVFVERGPSTGISAPSQRKALEAAKRWMLNNFRPTRNTRLTVQERERPGGGKIMSITTRYYDPVDRSWRVFRPTPWA